MKRGSQVRSFSSQAQKRGLICLLLAVFLSLSVSAALNSTLSDQGTEVKTKSTGNLLASGNLEVVVWDNLTEGNLIHNETFANAISNGTWNVMLGENSSNPLELEFGKIYYRDYKISGEDVDFLDSFGNTVERRIFYSPLGDIQGEDINQSANFSIKDLNVSRNITASYFIGDGSFLTGVLKENPFNQGLNTTENVTFNNVTSTSWFNGLFNWTISSASTRLLSFTGSILSFDQSELNNTISQYINLTALTSYSNIALTNQTNSFGKI